MKKQLLRFTLSAIIIYLTCGALNLAIAASQLSVENGTHFCGVIDGQSDKQHSDQFPNRRYARTLAANLDVGQPRTVRMIYFLPNDRPYRADVVQRMKYEILNIQSFFAEQMEAHGYGKLTFRVETDPQGEPIVHYVDGQHPDSHYFDDTPTTAYNELEEVFDLFANIYLIIIDNSINAIGLGEHRAGGIGHRNGKSGGQALVPNEFSWDVLAHELGHTFGLNHDFSDGTYIMSYGPGPYRLSACHAEFLVVQPYFNTNIPVEEGQPPTIELISPRTYPVSSQSVPVRLKVGDSDGLHQVLLINRNMKACRGLAGEKDAVVQFNYNDVIPPDGMRSLSNPAALKIAINAVDTDGNISIARFILDVSGWRPPETLQLLSKISGDNQHGVPNAPLPNPFIVQVRNLKSGVARSGVAVTFTITAGGGTLSSTRTTTNENGRAQSTLTLGPNLGMNAVKVSAAGIERMAIFIAVAADVVDIPDPNLRAEVETALGVSPGNPIVSTEMATLTILEARNANISDLTGLEGATNLRTLDLGAEYVEAENRSINSNSVSDFSPLTGLTKLRSLYLGDSNISNISAVAGLTNLTELNVDNNSISDISSVAGLTNLARLNLNNNAISDVSPLLGLNLTGTSWDSTGLSLERNPLSYVSINTHIPAIQAKGVEVKFDSRTATTLLNISGVITASDNVLTVEVRDSNGRIFEGVPVTFAVISGGGTLSVTNTTTDKKGRAQSTLTLGKESNRVTVSAVRAEQTATFSDVAEAGVHIPDPNLRAAIEDVLGVKSGSPISPEEMATLTYLRAREASIGVLIGLESATNLTELRLGNNGITDISPLSGLTNLRTLGLGRNSVTDISPLSGLTNLRTLGLSNNGITDMSAFVRVLSGLTNLTELHLRDNGITDISSLSGLTHLTELRLSGNHITDISPLSGLTNLRTLGLSNNGITDMSAFVRVLSGLTNLTELHLRDNGITDISSLSGLTHLTELRLSGNRITDISPLSGLTNLRTLDLPNGIQDLPALVRVLSRLTHLTSLSLSNNNIEDVSALIPVLSDLTDLRDLNLENNSISDISAVAGLTNLTSLGLGNNSISDLSPLTELTHLTGLTLWGNNISDISPVAGLTNLTILDLRDNNISDLSPLVENTGLGSQDWSWVGVGGNPLSYQSIHTHIPALQNRGVTVEFDNQAHSALLKISGGNQRRLPGETLMNPFVVEARDENGLVLAGISVTFTVTLGDGMLSIQSTTTNANGRAESTLTLGPNFGTNTVSVSAAEIPVLVTFNAIADNPEFLWSIPPGISLIHVPLKVTAVDEMEQTIESIADLYDLLGGALTVNFLITYDSQTQEWLSYFVPSDKGTSADVALTDDKGIIVGLRTPISIQLRGDPLGTDGSSAITLTPGINLVGLPLRDSRVRRVSHLFALDGIGGNVPVIILTDNGEFKAVGQADDPGDIAITGGQAFIMTAQREAMVTISGDGWYNVSEVAAGPPLSLKSIEVGDTTPVLGVRGSIIDEGTGVNNTGLRVRVKNLSTGRAVAAVAKDVQPSRTDKREPTEVGYQVTIVDVETGRAARIGDSLEVSVRSPDPFIGVHPLQYTVTAEDVRQSLIQLSALVAYEIPVETELLHNYPNPFNPETWIPYRLAEDAFVTLTIYDLSGHLVRTLEVGHRIAAVYESRSKTIYWDGRNRLGEQVASGVYFYHLSAGDYSATRKMLVMK